MRKTLLLLLLLPILAQAADLIGHRGARGLYPENTIPAFLAAIEMGVAGVELDVVITRDKQVLVSHDAYFDKDLCLKGNAQPISAAEEKKLNIYRMTYQQTQEYDCGSLYQEDYPRQSLQIAHKPLLADVFLASEALIHQQHYNPITYFVEVKSHHLDYGVYQPYPEEFADLVYQVIKQNAPVSQVVIISFDPAILRVFHDKYPEIRLGMLVYGTEPIGDVINALGFVPEFYGPGANTVTAEFVEQLHTMKMKVVSWTVNNPDEFQREVKLGIDGIVTDFPDLIGASPLD